MLVTITVIVGKLLMRIHNYKVQFHMKDEIKVDQESNDLIEFLNRVNESEGGDEFDTIHNSNEYSEKLKMFVHKLVFKNDLMELVKKWKLLELEFHEQNVSAFHFCLKNNIGTNETTKNVLKLLSPESKMTRICQNICFTKILTTKDIFHRANNCFMKFKTFMFGLVAGILNIVLYFIDFVKDVVFCHGPKR